MSVDRSTAAALAEQGLAAVFGAQIVAGLREDSPLAGIGLSAADLVCVSDAIADAAEIRDIDCVLGDADMDGLTTVADLVSVIVIRGESMASP